MPRWWESQKASSLIGLDITPHFIKLLEIDVTQSPYVLKQFAVDSLPVGAITNDGVKDAHLVVQKLKNMLKKNSFSSRDIAFSIPHSSVIIKSTFIDRRLTAAELESRVWIEANRHFPELTENIYLDYQVLPAKLENIDQKEIMLIACRKDKIDPYINILHAAGLKEKIVDVNCYAFERALKSIKSISFSDQTIALLNIDIKMIHLMVLQNNEIIYAHDYDYDGYRLVTQTNDYFKKIDAVNVPFKTDMPIEDNYRLILQENLGSHLRHVMHFFYSSRPNVNIQKLILSGECASIPSLLSFVQGEVGIETSIENPFLQMNHFPEINSNDLKKQAPMMMLCYGLALIKVST